MSMLTGFPMVSQLTKISADGTTPNDQMDCVPASIGAAILWYQGKQQWDNEIDPDRLLDMVYPEGYQGGTAAVKFVPACQKLGFNLHPFDGNAAQLVAEAHRQLALNHPVIFTEPDPYSSNPNDSHVCVFYADDPDHLIAMDPYPLTSTGTGHPVHGSNAEWASRLLFDQIWILERNTVSTLDLLKQHGWNPDGTTLIAPNGVPVVRGFRDFVLAHNWNPDNYPLAPEYGTPQLEGSNQALGGGTQQVFRWTMLGWTEAHGVFEEWTGQELLYLSKKVADYYKQVQDLQKQLSGGQPQPGVDPLASQALAVVRQIKTSVQPF